MGRDLGRALAVAATVVTLLIAPAIAGPALVVKGDATAWTEVAAALGKLRTVRTYRFKASFSGSLVSTTEVVNPDRLRVVLHEGGLEAIQVGKQVRIREGSGPWQCGDEAIEMPKDNPAAMTGEVTAARGPAVTIDGVQSRSYTYSWKSADVTTVSRLFVAAATGFPKRAQYLAGKDVVMAQLDYFDFDAPITITLPALPACK